MEIFVIGAFAIGLIVAGFGPPVWQFVKVYREARKFAFRTHGYDRLQRGQRKRFIRTYIRQWRELRWKK